MKHLKSLAFVLFIAAFCAVAFLSACGGGSTQAPVSVTPTPGPEVPPPLPHVNIGTIDPRIVVQADPTLTAANYLVVKVGGTEFTLAPRLAAGYWFLDVFEIDPVSHLGSDVFTIDDMFDPVGPAATQPDIYMTGTVLPGLNAYLAQRFPASLGITAADVSVTCPITGTDDTKADIPTGFDGGYEIGWRAWFLQFSLTNGTLKATY